MEDSIQFDFEVIKENGYEQRIWTIGSCSRVELWRDGCRKPINVEVRTPRVHEQIYDDGKFLYSVATGEQIGDIDGPQSDGPSRDLTHALRRLKMLNLHEN